MLIADSKLEPIETIRQLTWVLEPLVNQFPDVCFILIGSRARGNEKKYSDFDIGVTGGTDSVSFKKHLRLQSQLDDLVEDSPYMFDLINLDAAPSWFFLDMDYDPSYIVGSRQRWKFFQGKLNGIRGTKAAKTPRKMD